MNLSMNTETVILTAENLHELGNNGCGWNGHQLKILGVTEKKSGWLKRLIGKEIPISTFEELKRLRGVKRAERHALGYEPMKAPKVNRAKPPMKRIHQQYQHLRRCLKANELAAAEDHAKAILEIIQTA